MSKKLSNIMYTDLGYNVAGKKAFHSEGKRVLKSLAVAMGLSTTEYDLRSNKAGIAVSGEITLHTDNFYIQLAQTSFGLHNEILYRTCKGRKDYTGGMNHTDSVEALEDVDSFAGRLATIK